MRRDCSKAERRSPGDDNDTTPKRRHRGWPQSALKQATKRTDGDKEKTVTFVTDRQPETRPIKKEPVTENTSRPKGSIGDKRQNDEYTKIFKGRFKYYCV